MPSPSGPPDKVRHAQVNQQAKSAEPVQLRTNHRGSAKHVKVANDVPKPLRKPPPAVQADQTKKLQSTVQDPDSEPISEDDTSTEDHHLHEEDNFELNHGDDQVNHAPPPLISTRKPPRPKPQAPPPTHISPQTTTSKTTHHHSRVTAGRQHLSSDEDDFIDDD